MIQEFYGLDLDAFSLSPDLDFLYLSPAHEEAVAHLLYGLEQNEDIILIVGDIGTGKTLTLHRLTTQISSAFIPVSINVTTMDFEQVLRLVLLKIGFDAKADASLAFLIDSLEKQLVATRNQGKKVLLIIDEAQNLSVEVLESLRLLLNLAQPGGQALQLVLTGQLGLRTNLNKPEMRQLRQRIRVDYQFGFLTRQEVQDYVLHRLKTAGRTDPLFEEKALDRIFFLSKGVPRVVNLLASKALLAGYVDGSSKIKSKHLDDIPLDDLLDTGEPEGVPFIGGPVVSDPEPGPEPAMITVKVQEPGKASFDLPPEPVTAKVSGNIGRGWLVAAIFFLGVIAVAVAYPIWGPVLNRPRGADIALPTAANEVEAKGASSGLEAAPRTNPLEAGTRAQADGVTTMDQDEVLLHVASFDLSERGAAYTDQLRKKGFEAFFKPYVNERDKLWYRVYLGPYTSQQEASEVAANLKESGWIQFSRLTVPDPQWSTE